ncbi:MAG: phosphoribosyl-AMP cyclohydrolase [Armatimonadota bacterium]
MDLSELKFNEKGLIPAIAFDVDEQKIVMLAYMNEEAVRRTLETGEVTYWSRSRQDFWVKGQSSGHTQQLQWIRLDCDGDALLVGIKQNVAACHLGYFSCFFRKYEDGEWKVVEEKVFDPDKAYGG